MRRIWGAKAAFVLGLVLCSPAWATTVEVLKGVVSVKQGEGFRQVKGSAEVYNGNKVMAAPGGLARIVYPDGCTVQVGPGGVATVGECKQPMTAGLECDPSTDDKCLAAPPVARTPWLLYGAIGVGVGIGIACASGEDWPCPHGHGPRSP
jgi:hypothetical protein